MELVQLIKKNPKSFESSTYHDWKCGKKHSARSIYSVGMIKSQ